MIYELKTYGTASEYECEEEREVIVWENKEKGASPNEIKGALRFWYGRARHLTVPSGICEIRRGAFYSEEADIFDCPLESIEIPATVRKIEEGAFSFTELKSVTVHPDCPCAKVMNGGLYTKDGKTLLLAFKVKNGVFKVPEGVERIGIGAISNRVETLVLPASLKEFAIPRDYARDLSEVLSPDCRIEAPAGSYAARLAKRYGFEKKE